jgi:hypothetical protein
MAKVTIEFDDIGEAIAALALIGGGSAAVKPAKPAKAKAAAAAEVAGSTEAPVSAEKPAAEKPAAEKPAAEKPATETPAAVATVTRDDAAKAIIELSKKKGRAAAVAVLEKFRPEGYNEPEVKLPAVAKENYAALVAEAKKALEAEAE